MLLKIICFWICVGSAVGFMCYTCSYGGEDLLKHSYACLQSPEDIRSVKCGNFCVTQEQFDKKTNTLKSFARTCSVNWGNQCLEDDFSIICQTTCTGDYCNANLKPDPDTVVPPTVCPEFTAFTTDNSDGMHVDKLCVLLVIVIAGL